METLPREDSWIGEERRHPRIATAFTALHADENGSFREDIVSNVSRGGLFLRTKSPRPKGESIELILLLPNSTCEVTVQGEVMYSASLGAEEFCGMGIMFTAIEPSLKIILEEYLFELEERSATGRRSYPRLENPASRLHIHGASGRGNAHLVNLSRSGLFLETQTPVTLFERLDFILTDPETGKSLELSGEVVHLRKTAGRPRMTYGAGIRFHDLDDEKQKSILALIRRLSTREKLN